MYIKRIEINNFRGIRAGTVHLQPGMNIIIGPSNVGKTTILQAIDFALNPYLAWWRRDLLGEFDYYKRNLADPIVIKILLGCSRPRCADAENPCPRLEITSGDKTAMCKLRDYTITVDKSSGNILKIYEIGNDTDIECCLFVKLEAAYNEDNGYAETSHTILNEDGETWVELTRSMKEWIGILLMDSSRDPIGSSRLARSSLLSKAIGDVTTWEKRYFDEFKQRLATVIDELRTSDAKSVLQSVTKCMEEISPDKGFAVSIGIDGANRNELVRQVALSYNQGEHFQLPLSCHGTGHQQITSLILGTIAQTKVKDFRPPLSIFMVEEPEQNLEPQKQRSILRFLNNYLLSDSEYNGEPGQPPNYSGQIILTTHSPFIISSDLHLNTIVKLKNDNDGTVSSQLLGQIEHERKRFYEIRKQATHDMELFENLFSELIIIWEGDCEIGLYQTLMRQTPNYPAELLTGLIGGGGRTPIIANWLKNAGYKVIVVLDNDEVNTINELQRTGIYFVTLPPGKKIEQILSESLIIMDNTITTSIIVKAISVFDEVYNYGDFTVDWPELAEVFRKHRETRKLPTPLILSAISENPPLTISADSVLRVLTRNKKRYVHETLARELAQFYMPMLLRALINHLKSAYVNHSVCGQYQLTEEGKLVAYLKA